MLSFLRRGRPAGPAAARRPRLAFDLLESRDCPSAWDVPLDSGSGTTTSGDTDPTQSVFRETQPANAAPIIDGFDCEELGGGLCLFTGRVLDERPAGMVVTFHGVPGLEGRTATVGADGTFALTVQLKTDGSDAGTVWCVTYDDLGLKSNEPELYITPG